MLFKRAKNITYQDQDPRIIAWHRNDQGPDTAIMHIFPQPKDTMKNKEFFAVKEYEKALFYSKGELVGIIGGGIYELDKKTKIKGTEIVWIDVSLNEIPWGIPQSSGIPSKNGIIVGVHGDLKFRISDIKTFYQDVVAGGKIWTKRDIQLWIRGLLRTSLRDVLKNLDAKEILLENREHIHLTMLSKLTEEFLTYGLELENFNILGIQPPDDMDSLYTLEQEKSKYAEELELLNLKKELEAKKRELDAAKKDFDRVQAELDAKADLEKTKYTSQAEKLKKKVDLDLMREKTEISEGTGKIASQKEQIIKNNIRELKNKLDEFDKLYIAGKISEDVYSLRIKRIEMELKDLESKLLNL
ncbi:MAG: hypothetical protein BAJALOKI1v1_780012 [Promethearchaeota archaeon]|nr:MAG: hypothetical protein BAJALOKI1v1_780012 [Candidatus Lokiarchaeota archaeon]